MSDDALEAALGHPLDESTWGSVDDLNRFPLELVEEARRLLPLGRIPVFRFVHHYAARERFDHVNEFIDDVIRDGAEAETWRRSDALCVVDPDLHRLLPVSSDDAAARLRELADAEPGWTRLVVDPDRWSTDATGIRGAPGVVVRRRHYKSSLPTGLRALVLGASDRLEPVERFPIAYRRWVALRIAWSWLVARKRPGVPADSELALDGQPVTASTDALLALRGLRRELEELGDDPEQVPGFRGSDAWYEE